MTQLQLIIKWLEDNERPQSWLTGKLGVPRNTFTYWKRGQSINKKYWAKIEELTNIKLIEEDNK